MNKWKNALIGFVVGFGIAYTAQSYAAAPVDNCSFVAEFVYRSAVARNMGMDAVTLKEKAVAEIEKGHLPFEVEDMPKLGNIIDHLYGHPELNPPSVAAASYYEFCTKYQDVNLNGTE